MFTSKSTHFEICSLPNPLTSKYVHFEMCSLPNPLTSKYVHFQIHSLRNMFTSKSTHFEICSLPNSLTSKSIHFKIVAFQIQNLFTSKCVHFQIHSLRICLLPIHSLPISFSTVIVAKNLPGPLRGTHSSLREDFNSHLLYNSPRPSCSLAEGHRQIEVSHSQAEASKV